MLVKVFSIEKGLEEYNNAVAVRIKSKDYNLLIFKGYLSILGEVDGNIDIETENDNISYKGIKAYYINNNNVISFIMSSGKDD